MKQSPGWAYLISIQPENLYSRWISTNYVFNFTIFDKIPPLEKMGYLQIDFPKGFQITDKNVTCNYNAQIELTCNISNNVLRAYGNLDYING